MHQLVNRGARAALLTLAGSALAVTAVPAPAYAGGHPADRASAAAAHRSGGPGVRLAARLTGAQDVGGAEVPYPQTVANRPQATGDPDGTGTATMTISPATGRICFTITTSNIDTPRRAHIHHQVAGQNGPIAVELYESPGSPGGPLGGLSGCTTTSKAEARNLVAHPAQYYVNVHNDPYPAGAVRGQLTHGRR